MFAFATFGAGCVPLRGGWDSGGLEVLYPTLDQYRDHRLGDSPPYLLPQGDRAILFLCRFSTEAPIPVSLPEGATADQLAAIRRALDGWAKAGLGVAFVEVPSDEARIGIHLIRREEIDEHEPNSPPLQGTGYTVSDCVLRPGWRAAAEKGAQLPASLDHAWIGLHESNTNMIGREVPLSEDEFIGAALHELGHALGFPGHLATPGGVMTKSTDTVRTIGRRLRNTGRFASPSLAALYALPNGTVVGRAQLAPEDGALFEQASKHAESQGWSGPYINVGEEHASIQWRDGLRHRWTLRLRAYRETLRAEEPLSFHSSQRARALRDESNELPPTPR